RSVRGVVGRPVNLSRVQDGVSSSTNINECSLHAGEHILNFPEIHVPYQRGLTVPGHVVLYEHVVFKSTDLYPVLDRAYDHAPVDGLTSGEELGLSNHGTTTPSLTSLTPALLFCF